MENDDATFLVDFAKDLQTNARTAEMQVRGAYEIAREIGDSEFLRLLKDFGNEARKIWSTSYQACQRAEENDRGVSTEEIHRSLGFSLLAMQRWEEAFEEFEASAGTNPRWREGVVEGAQDYIGSRESYSRIKAWLAEQFEASRTSRTAPGSHNALAALLLLVRQQYWKAGQHDGLQSEPALSHDSLLMVTPIVVEAHTKLFPPQENWEKTHPLFQRYVPELRERIMTEIGVRIPRVLFRGNEADIPANSYVIMINEVPLVLGTVRPDRKFSPSYDEACLILEENAKQLKPVFNPLSGESDGAWIEEKHWDDFELSGATLFDEFEYMTYHLERVLRADLTPYLGVQEVDDLIREWLGARADNKTETLRRRELLQQTLTDSRESIRFVQVLQGLVSESAPITELSTILESFQKQRATDAEVTSLVEAARLSIKNQLAGNSASFEFVYLSRAFEDEVNRWCREVDGKVIFEIPPEETQALLAAFRSGIEEGKQSGLAVVTQSPNIRPFFRRLIVLEFPRVVVLSAKELRSDLHALASNTIEYTPTVKTLT